MQEKIPFGFGKGKQKYHGKKQTYHPTLPHSRK